LIYALPEGGDEIIMFMVDLQNNQKQGMQRQRPGNAGGGPMKSPGSQGS